MAMGNLADTSLSKGKRRDPTREEWTKEKEISLAEEINKLDIMPSGEDGESMKKHILLCGPNKAGKSSFMNSAIGVCKGRQCHISSAGASSAAGISLTKKYIRVAAPDIFNRFRLSDTPGLLEPTEHGLHIDDINALVKGHIKPGYTFQNEPITIGSEWYVSRPTEDEMVHCLVFVFDVTTFRVLNTNYEEKIRQIIEKLHSATIPFVVVLTKIDLFDKKVDKDIRKMHESAKVRDEVREVSRKFGVEERNVFPVVNHVKDIDIKPLTKIPHLLALRNILGYANDYRDVHLNQNDCFTEPKQETNRKTDI